MLHLIIITYEVQIIQLLFQLASHMSKLEPECDIGNMLA